MAPVNEKALLIQSMVKLLDELSAPDLTIARANVLRPQLASLMAVVREFRSAAEDDGARVPPFRAEPVAPNHPLCDLLPFPTPIALRSVG